MTSVRRALMLSLTERYLLIAISLASNILIARLLTPEQIGIYSISLAVIGIAQVLRDFGIGNFLIQERDLSNEHIRAAFGISLLIGGALFVVVVVGATWVGRFYGEEQMVTTLRITALNFLVLPFCTISLALLRREMQFKRLLYVGLGSSLAGTVVTIVLAFAGLGANSMAIGAVIGNIATGLGAWIGRTERRVLLPSLRGWRPLLRFGVQASTAGVVTSISIDINDLALGKILGFAPVAMIGRAQGLMNLFHRDLMGAIRNVAYPAYARAHRENCELESHYIASVSAVTVLGWPFYGFVALFPLEIIRWMFGPQWDEAAALVPLFCLAGAIGATSNLISSIMLAVGRVDLVTKSELTFQPLRAAAVVAAAVIVQSLWACAMAYLLAYVLYTPLIYWFKGRCIPNDFGLLWKRLTVSALVSIAALIGPGVLAVNAGLGRATPIDLYLFCAAGILSILGWGLAALYLQHPILQSDALQRLMRVCRRR